MAEQAFAHEAERELAALMSFYRIRWVYEPRTFPVRFDEAGAAVEFFTPDFWCPDLNLYIECTTLRQPLTTHKHRKCRLFRELYPQYRLVLLQAADFRAMMIKSGHPERLVSMMGAAGQLN